MVGMRPEPLDSEDITIIATSTHTNNKRARATGERDVKFPVTRAHRSVKTGPPKP